MDGKNIHEVTSLGISYQDDTGEMQFIEFERCYQNGIAEWMNPERLEQTRRVNNMDEQRLATYIERRKSAREVGRRNAIGQPSPYIEFYTIPPVCFYFADYTVFRELDDAVIKAGWRTFDMS